VRASLTAGRVARRQTDLDGMGLAMTTDANQRRTLLRARAGVAAIFFANGFGIGAWAVAIPQVKAMFGLTDGALAFVLLAAGVGAIATMPLAGVLPPRFGGTGPTLRLAGPLFAVLLAALPLTHVVSGSIAPLAIVACLFGSANILVDVPMNAHASVVERGWGAPIMSSFHAAWSGGGLAGAVCGGFLIGLGASPALQLGLEAAAIFAVALPASLVIGIGDAHHRSGRVFALPDRKLIALALIAMLAVYGESAVTDWSALYLKSEIGLAPGAASAGFSGYALMMLLGRALGDAVVRVLGHRSVVLLGAALTFAGALLAIVSAAPAIAIAGFCLVGLGLANMVPTVFSASAAAASSPSLGVAMSAGLAYSAYLVGPPVFGAIASASSLRMAFATLLAAMAAIVALAMRLGRAAPGGRS
jgi:MFS family permease